MAAISSISGGLMATQTNHNPAVRAPGAGPRSDGTAPKRGPSASASPRELSADEAKEVRELKARDREVRAHEQAHKAAAGRYGGAVSFTYEVGPDGRRYAVGGEVSIDTSAVAGDPEATIRKMEVVIRAALAPAQPSAQDRAVAARARQTATAARTEKMTEERAETEESSRAAPDRAASAPGPRSGYDPGSQPAAGTLLDLFG